MNATMLGALALLLGSGKAPNEAVKMSYGSSEPQSNSSPCDIPEGCHACYDPCALDPPEPCRRDPLTGIPTDDDSLAILASLDWPRRDLQWFLEAFKAANNNFEFEEQTTTSSPFSNVNFSMNKRKGVKKVDSRQKLGVSAAVFNGPIVISVNCGSVSEEQIVDVENFANEFRLDLILSIMKRDTSKIQLEAIQRGVEKLAEKESLELSFREQNITFGNNTATLQHQLAFRKTDIISSRMAMVGTVINVAVSGFVEMTSLPGITSVGLTFLGDLPTCKRKFSSLLRPTLAVCNPNDPYRTLDGSCNNVANELWGAAFTAFRRDLAPSYDDGVSTFRRSVFGNELPSARLISNMVNNVRSEPSKSYSILHMTYGQFIDHDLTSTPLSRASFFGYPISESPIKCCFPGFEAAFLHPECAPIRIPFNDPLYSCFKEDCMEFVRSAPTSGDCQMGPREQTNQHSSYLDGSVIYGVKPEETDDLRTFVDGLLKIQLSKDGQVLLPKDSTDGGQCNTPDRMKIGEFCFRAGDGRVNEQILLTFFQTVWAREHNRVAKILKRNNDDWNDEKLFQETRRIVGAQLQQITYSEFLPSLIGPTLMATSKLNPLEGDQQTTDYVEFINAAIANNFATAAYRFGHSLITDNVLFVTKYGKTTPKELSTMFFNPFELYKKDGMCDVARGGLNLPQNEMDPHFTPEVAGKLFRGAKPFGLDLFSLNIQRGRDHGLPPYNKWRVLCGLPRANSFEELKDQMTQERILALTQVYEHVDDIDLYVGGVSENPIPGALLGHTFTCLVHNQFFRMKYGDRYWFEYKDGPGAFTTAQIKQLHRVTLARVMCNNLPELDYIQRWPLKTPGPDNPKVCCKSIRQYNLDPWNPDFVEVEEEVEENECCDDAGGDDCCKNKNPRK
ncbi:peroxidase-like [Macrobrachium rosenbergii]|uniref:peroxidase-like n=1 Tax=Macrobrachium rosenbergii TaxID=79674 RepID=UPI0034D5182F